MKYTFFGILLVLNLPLESLGQHGANPNKETMPANYHQVKITSSAILINGATNVNQFQCGLDQPAINDSIIVKNIWSNQKLDFEGLRLMYRVADFECGISAMNSDFQEILKAETYPELSLQLNSITLHQGNDTFEELNVAAEVEINLAGVLRRIEVINGKIHNHSSAHLTLKGEKDLLMSDFQIAPPVKFLGMVKVSNNIQIEFQISMEVSAL